MILTGQPPTCHGCRKKLGEVPLMNAVATLPPPPLAPQPAEMFAAVPDITGLSLLDHGAYLEVPKAFEYRCAAWRTAGLAVWYAASQK